MKLSKYKKIKKALYNVYCFNCNGSGQQLKFDKETHIFRRSLSKKCSFCQGSGFSFNKEINIDSLIPHIRQIEKDI